MSATLRGGTKPTMLRSASSAPTKEAAPAYRQAILLGFAAGLRSMTPFALLAWTRRPDTTSTTTLERVLNSPDLKLATGLAAAGEIVADKLPFVPSRLRPGPLGARLAIGALSGAALSRRAHQPVATGAAVGAASALLGAVAGYGYRSLLYQFTTVPDFVWAGLEDAAAVGLGLLAVRKS